MVSIVLKDGKKLEFEKEIPLFEVAKSISNSLLQGKRATL